MRLRLQENTASRLVIDLQLQWAWVYWLFGALFLVGSCTTIFFLARATEFTCTRNSGVGQCQLQETIAFWSERKVVPLDALISANIKTDHIGTVSANDLVISGRENTLKPHFMAADVNTKLIYANQFNIFKRTPAQLTLTIQEDLRWLGFGLGLLLALASFLCLKSLRTITFDLDVASGKFVIRTKPLLEKPKQESFDLEEIKTVDISSAEFDSGKYNVFLRFKDDQTTLIAGPFISANARQFRAYILTFLQESGREVIY
jgi:hypothetical protein